MFHFLTHWHIFMDKGTVDLAYINSTQKSVIKYYFRLSKSLSDLLQSVYVRPNPSSCPFVDNLFLKDTWPISLRYKLMHFMLFNEHELCCSYFYLNSLRNTAGSKLKEMTIKQIIYRESTLTLLTANWFYSYVLQKSSTVPLWYTFWLQDANQNDYKILVYILFNSHLFILRKLIRN